MKFIRVLTGAIALFLAARPQSISAATAETADQITSKGAKQRSLNLPLRFEENTGSFDPRVKFLAHGPGYTLFLAPAETVLIVPQEKRKQTPLRHAKGRKVSRAKASVVRVRLEGANDTPLMRGENKFAAPTSYLIGSDPAKWGAVNNYERVRVESVYPGIDMLYYGRQRGLEYDFEVAPGVDPRRIALRYEGVSRLRVEADGSLVSQLKGGGELRQNRPISYQMVRGERREVASRYVVRGKRTAAVVVGEYDSSEPLVIDPPVLSYSTYLGGGGAETSYAIAVDASGLVYVTGTTTSTDFPTLGQYQIDQGVDDVFVAKLDPSLTGAAALLYSTYLGGNGAETGHAIAVDAAGNVFVTGETGSTNFPTLNPYQTDQPGIDAFVTKLNTNVTGAASLVYSTYLGGDGSDIARGIGIGSGGNAFITGETTSTNFPTLNQYQTAQGSRDAFVTKLNPSLSGAASLLYSTYLGGGSLDGANAIAVDGNFAYIAGSTISLNFPALNAYQSSHLLGNDAFVAKLNPSLNGAASLLYSTYLAGNGDDAALGIAAAGGIAYVTGFTFSPDFPTLNQYQAVQTPEDAFVTKIDTRLSGMASLLYSTYLGGTGSEHGRAIALSGAGNVFITGETDSTNFPTLDPIQAHLPGEDAFVTKLSTTASGAASLLFSTYLGGTLNDIGWGLAIQSADIYVTGRTSSSDFPTLNQFQTNQIGDDAFVTKLQGGFQLIEAVSRKAHGPASFDIALPLTGAAGVECRSGGPGSLHSLIFTFSKNVASGTANIAVGGGFIDGPPVISGATMTVNLGDVNDVQDMTLRLSNVMAVGTGAIPSLDVHINFLVGDTTGNKTVNASDVGQTKANSGAALSDLNFRADTNVSGSITASDISQVKANAGHFVP